MLCCLINPLKDECMDLEVILVDLMDVLVEEEVVAVVDHVLNVLFMALLAILLMSAIGNMDFPLVIQILVKLILELRMIQMDLLILNLQHRVLLLHQTH